MVLILNQKVHTESSSYSASVMSYTENGSYIEYAQINGLNDEKKQDQINQILKDQVLYGAKAYNNEYFVDFSYPNYTYEFHVNIGYMNENIASFYYYFDAYGEIVHSDGSVSRDTSRSYGVTIDMQTGKKVELSDFISVDERLFSINDGTGIETNYNSVVNYDFHNMKDFFMIYDSEEERDFAHVFSKEEVIDMLVDKKAETNWYIDENKNVVFYFMDNSIEIPVNKLSDLICFKKL